MFSLMFLRISMVKKMFKPIFKKIICIVFTVPLEENESSSYKKEPEDDIDEPEPDTTLFIKNINFNTTEENITKVF